MLHEKMLAWTSRKLRFSSRAIVVILPSLPSLSFPSFSIRRDPITVLDFQNKRLGKYSDDDSITSITEFSVQKHSRHPVRDHHT